MLTKTQYALTQSALDLIARRRHGDNHTVAAAALDSAGQIHTGLNVHHFTGGPCAELVVIGQAATVSKALPLTTIVAALDAAPDAGVAGGVVPPCGRCRQVLFDYFPDIRVIVHTPGGLEAVPVRDLLPHCFDRTELGLPPRLHFAPRYLEAVRAGTKTTTVRHHDPVPNGPVRLVFGDTVLPATVTEQLTTTVAALAKTDTAQDGFTDHADPLAALEQHCPGLEPDAEVVVVHFTLTGRDD